MTQPVGANVRNRLRQVWARAQDVMQDNDLDLISAGVAFYALLSVFPAVAAVISIFGLVADPHVVEDQLIMWRDVIPPQAYTLFDTQIRTLLAAGRGTLGWTTGLWCAPIGWSGLIVSASWASGPLGRCFPAQAVDSRGRCVA